MTSPSLPLSSESLTIVPDSFPFPGEARIPSAADVADGQPRTVAEVVDHEAMGYRAWGTPTGEFLARQMERLAQLVRWTGATTPEVHEDRMQVWDDDLRQQWEDRGYEAGYAAGRREGRRLAFDEVLLVLKRS